MSISFDQVIGIARHIVDPRGRCDRRALLLATVGLLALQLGLALLFVVSGGDLKGTTFLMLNLPLLWIGLCMVLKRLHDIGWSGWWVLPAMLLWVVGIGTIVLTLTLVIGPARFDALTAAYPVIDLALLVLCAIPPFGGLLWLQASRGAPTANRFGPVPAAYGMGAPYPRSREGRVAVNGGAQVA